MPNAFYSADLTEDLTVEISHEADNMTDILIVDQVRMVYGRAQIDWSVPGEPRVGIAFANPCEPIRALLNATAAGLMGRL